MGISMDISMDIPMDIHEKNLWIWM